jgi:amphi-Trp domain-containing protein
MRRAPEDAAIITIKTAAVARGGIRMSDVKVEFEQTISRDEVAAWLSQLARAFAGDHDVEVPFGPGTVKLHVPGSVRADLEVEVEDDEVEIEIEFKWPLSQRNGEHRAATVAADAKGLQARRSGPTARVGQGTPGTEPA